MKLPKTAFFTIAFLALFLSSAVFAQGQGQSQDQDRSRDQVDRDQQVDRDRDYVQDRDRDQDRLRDPDPDQDRDRDRDHDNYGEAIYGYQLMSEEERNQYRTRIMAAENDAQRNEIREQHRNEMRVRATEQGIDLD